MTPHSAQLNSEYHALTKTRAQCDNGMLYYFNDPGALEPLGQFNLLGAQFMRAVDARGHGDSFAGSPGPDSADASGAKKPSSPRGGAVGGSKARELLMRADGVLYILQAQTQEERDAWLRALTDIANEYIASTRNSYRGLSMEQLLAKADNELCADCHARLEKNTAQVCVALARAHRTKTCG